MHASESTTVQPNNTHGIKMNSRNHRSCLSTCGKKSSISPCICWRACHVSSFFIIFIYGNRRMKVWWSGKGRRFKQLSHHQDITRCRWYQASYKGGTKSRSRCPSTRSSWVPQYYLWPRDEIADSSPVENAGFLGSRQWWPLLMEFSPADLDISRCQQHVVQ